MYFAYNPHQAFYCFSFLINRSLFYFPPETAYFIALQAHSAPEQCRASSRKKRITSRQVPVVFMADRVDGHVRHCRMRRELTVRIVGIGRVNQVIEHSVQDPYGAFDTAPAILNGFQRFRMREFFFGGHARPFSEKRYPAANAPSGQFWAYARHSAAPKRTAIAGREVNRNGPWPVWPLPSRHRRNHRARSGRFPTVFPATVR